MCPYFIPTSLNLHLKAGWKGTIPSSLIQSKYFVQTNTPKFPRSASRQHVCLEDPSGYGEWGHMVRPGNLVPIHPLPYLKNDVSGIITG